MAVSEHPLTLMVRKLELWKKLDDADREAILRLPHVVRDIPAGQYVAWEGDRPQYCCLLLSGIAIRQKGNAAGERQILSIHLPGDLVDLQNSLLGKADHNVQMLTTGSMACIAIEAVTELAFERPTVGYAMWYETLVEGSIFREWILNIGRRDARTRISHLLCEVAVRMEAAAIGTREYTLPVTQEQLADAVALTSAHVSRTLKKLASEGLIRRSLKQITICDTKGLAAAGEFRPDYLYLNKAGRHSKVLEKS